MTPAPPSRSLVLRGVKQAAFAIARATGVVAAARVMNRRRLPILCYHSIVAAPVEPWVAAGGLHLPLDRFRRQMEMIGRLYRVRPLRELLPMLRNGEAIPPRAIALTFDDGYANNLDVAADLLTQLGFPATIFLATDYISSRSVYWWDELPALLSACYGRRLELPGVGTVDLKDVGALSSAVSRCAHVMRAATLVERRQLLDALSAHVGGVDVPRPMTWDDARAAPSVIDFGGHGASHRILDGISVAEALSDAERCRVEIQRQLPGRWTDAFCYPEGRSTADVRAGLASRGWRYGVTAMPRPADDALAGPRDDMMQLPRIGVAAGMSDNVFLAQIAGLRQRPYFLSRAPASGAAPRKS